jgi:hypothetical protein
MQTRYEPKTIHELQKCLEGCRDKMPVEVRGVSLDAKTVADLRSLLAWPPGVVIDVHNDPDPRFSFVKVERKS